jgi:hypothetical protein
MGQEFGREGAVLGKKYAWKGLSLGINETGKGREGREHAMKNVQSYI